MEYIEKNQTYIVIPVYNEEKNIVAVIGDLLKYGYKIVVIDDCSKDNTWNALQNLPVIKLKHKINRGQGAALQTGTEFALKSGASVIVHFDGDGQFLPEEIEPVIAPILSGECDVVLGSRFYTDKRRLGKQINADSQIPFLKKYINLPVSRIINYFFTGLNLTDAHCGFRAMNKITAEKINITQDRMSHNTEIVAQIKKNNLKYKEVPVTVIYKEFGQGVSGGFRILRDLILAKLINK